MNTDKQTTPALGAVLETALYVADLEQARGFYETVLNLEPLFADHRLCAYDVAGRTVLLLFKRGASTGTTILPGGTIPPHDAAGHQHIAFAVTADELPAWENALTARGIEIEGRTNWPKGGTSIYFRDPDGHLLELATPGLWKTY
ncbi:VOC family protein [Microvirga antarctica]|uniref:VOC family protein n=1 Tax=Microvirga antarctica TaxID=2819233 RepID=UPI001B312DA6|nr:VOC family protein [Microvirga antarctica]